MRRARPKLLSRNLVRVVVGICVGALALCGAARSAAAGSANESEGAADPSDTPGTATGASGAAIVLVGEIPESDELVLLLRELLGRNDVECEFSEASRFDPDALFAEGEATDKVRVFVRQADAKHARLYFRGPSGERFLLRTITLPSGFDEVGRELVGQVVESSIVTLLRSSSGLSREEASAELARENRAAETPPAPRRTPTPEKHGKPKERTFAFSAALRYAALWFGPDLEIGHGPGVELGVGTLGEIRLRGRVSAEWFFDQTLDIAELRTEVETKPLRASVDVGLPLAPQHLVALGIGAGVDLSRVEPSAARAEDVTPGEPQSSIVPVLRPELRYELNAGSLVVGASVFVDVSLVYTHYDLLEGERSVELGAPWTARPGGALMFGIAW